MNIKPQTVECVGGLTLAFYADEFGTVARVKACVGPQSWMVAFGANGEVKRISLTQEFELTERAAESTE